MPTLIIFSFLTPVNTDLSPSVLLLFFFTRRGFFVRRQVSFNSVVTSLIAGHCKWNSRIKGTCSFWEFNLNSNKIITLWAMPCSAFTGLLKIGLTNRSSWRLQWERHSKIELRGWSSASCLVRVGHFLRNVRTVLSFDWHEWSISYKGREGKIYYRGSRCHQNLKFEHFTSSSVWQTTSKKCT